MERAPKSGHRDHRGQEHQAVSSRRDLPVQFEIAAALNCAAVSIVQTVRGFHVGTRAFSASVDLTQTLAALGANAETSVVAREHSEIADASATAQQLAEDVLGSLWSNWLRSGRSDRGQFDSR
jgi:hypothetical protein